MKTRRKARKGSRVIVNKRGAGGRVKVGDKGTIIDSRHGDFAMVILDGDVSHVAINHVGLDSLSALDKMVEAIDGV